MRRAVVVVLALCVLGLAPANAEQFQKAVSVVESFLPLGFLLVQGTDTPLEYAVFMTSVGLHTVPNAALQLAVVAGRPQLTSILRWLNFGIDAAAVVGTITAGIAYASGAYGEDQASRSRSSIYFALAAPAAIAAFADFLPYAIEPRRGSDEPEPEPEPGT